jgi:hypothetical protein
LNSKNESEKLHCHRTIRRLSSRGETCFGYVL